MTIATAMRREYSAAKRAWAVIPLAQSVALLIATASYFSIVDSVFAAGTGIVVLLAAAIAREVAGGRYSRAEELRRALVRTDGWGKRPESYMLLLLLAEGSSTESWDPPPIGGYFASPHPPGARRVAHIVEQAAFFTVRHASTMATVCVTLTALCFGTGVALLWLVANGQTSPSAEPGFTQAAGALLAFVPTSEFLSLWRGYARLRRVGRSALQHCGRLAARKSPNEEEVAFVVASYDAGLAQGPPIPGLVYRLQRERLEHAWAQHEAEPVGSIPGGQHG